MLFHLFDTIDSTLKVDFQARAFSPKTLSLLMLLTDRQALNSFSWLLGDLNLATNALNFSFLWGDSTLFVGDGVIDERMLVDEALRNVSGCSTNVALDDNAGRGNGGFGLVS